MAHEAVGLAADRASVPLLEVLVAALALVEARKVDVDDDVALALGALLVRAAREGAEEDELERGRVGDGREEARAQLDAEVELLPASEVHVRQDEGLARSVAAGARKSRTHQVLP